jgi:hypothetical protein
MIICRECDEIINEDSGRYVIEGYGLCKDCAEELNCSTCTNEQFNCLACEAYIK